MANTFRATLLALNPTNYWPLNDALLSATLQDLGSAGDDMAPQGPGGTLSEYWYRAPGLVVRGTNGSGDRSYGISSNTFNPNPYAANQIGHDVIGHTTGAWGCTFVIRDQNTGDDCTLVSETMTNNSGFGMRLRVDTNYSLIFELLGTSGKFLRKQVLNGTILPGVPYSCAFIQRADGNGIQMFLNGSLTGIADSFGGGMTVDSWWADVFSTFLMTQTTIAGVNVGNPNSALEASENFTVGEVWAFENAVITDQEAADLHTSMNVGSAASDFFEWCFDLNNGSAMDMPFFGPGWIGANGALSLGNGPPSFECSNERESGFLAGQQNQPDNVVGRQIVTEYNSMKMLYADPQNSTFFDISNQSSYEGTESVGTIHCIVTVTSVPNGIRKIISTWGSSQSNSFELGLIGSVLGYQFFFRAFQASVETYRVLSGIIHLGADPQFWVLTVTQAGSDIKLYVNGSDETGIAPITTNPAVWIFTYGRQTIRWGGEQGSSSIDEWAPGELHKQVHLRYAQNAAQVADFYNAVLGIFPPEQPVPSFVTLLETTGNGGTGPDWWWRCNAQGAPLLDVGSAQDMAGPNADTIAVAGNPLFDVTGPFSPVDTDNRSVFFDGLLDSFEVGVAGVKGQLLNPSTGTVGFYFSRNALEDENIVFSIGNDAYTQFLQFGMNDDRIEIKVQTSAGNSATYTSGKTLDGNFFLCFITCDGTNYQIYINGAEDPTSSVVVEGTGAEGDWFDLITADQTAIGAKADVAFTTETTGRISELFLYDGEVLSAATIATLAEAAIADGLLGAPSSTAVVTFENVTFKNGALADIKVQRGAVSTQQQFVRANKCRFIGGMQGDAVEAAQTALLVGPVIGQFRGCTVDLQAPVGAFGRGGIVGTAVNPALVSSNDGSILVSDCDFDSIGFIDGTDFRAAVMCLAAFGMTVEGSRFRDCLGTGIGWLADAQRVKVINNQIEGVTAALGGIYVAQGLNARLGSGWLIRGNKVIDTAGNAININGVSSAGGLNFARNIAILENETDNNTTGVGIRANQVGDLMIDGNKSNRCTEGIRLGAITSAVKVRRNEVTENSLTGIICSEGTLQLADLTVDRNLIDGGAALGDGVTLVNLRNFALLNNKLQTLDLGIQIGTIGVEGLIDGNQVLPSVSTPFALLAPPITGLSIGNQQIEDLGNANVLDVTGLATITVQAHHHGFTNSGGAQNIDTINGPAIDGWLLVLRRAPFSNDVTFRDGIDNLDIGSDFLMDADNDQLWLERDGANWLQVSRFQA